MSTNNSGEPHSISLKIGEKEIALAKQAESNIYHYSADIEGGKPIGLSAFLSSTEFDDKLGLPPGFSDFKLEQVTYDIPNEQLEIVGRIKSSPFVLSLAGKNNPEIKLQFAAKEQETLSLGELVQHSLPASLESFLPAVKQGSETGLIQLLDKGGLSELKFEKNTLTGDMSLSAAGEVMGIKGSVWLSVLSVEEQLFFLHIKGQESNAQSIPQFLSQQLGLSIPVEVEGYLPKMKIALTEFSFDQLEKRFYMLGVIKQGKVAEGIIGYRLQGELEVKWGEGLYLSINLDANDAPVTLAALANDLNFSLEEIKKSIPENVVNKIGLSTFYNFRLLVDSANEEFEIAGKVALLDAFMVDASFFYSKEKGIRFEAQIDYDPLSLEEIIDILGIEVDKNQIPALDVGICLTEIYFDQYERWFSLTGIIETENGEAEISIDIEFNDGIKFDLKYTAEEETAITVGDMVSSVLPKQWVKMLPAPKENEGGVFLQKLKESALFDFELGIDTGAGEFLLNAGGEIVDFEGEIRFAIERKGNKPAVSLLVTGEDTNATSIKDLVKDRLGISMSADVEAFLPTMQAGLTKLSFDQAAGKFDLAGIITNEKKSYSLTGNLGIAWQDGLALTMVLDAEKAPISIYDFTEGLPIPADELNKIVPKKLLDEIKFYHLDISLNSVEQKYEVNSTIGFFGAKVKSGISIFKIDEKRFFTLAATVDSLDFNSLIEKAGITGLPKEIPNFTFKDIDFSINTQTEAIAFKGMSSAAVPFKLGETTLALRLGIDASYSPKNKLKGTFDGELDLAGVTFTSKYVIDKNHTLSFEPQKTLKAGQKDKGVALRTFINDLIPGAGYPDELPDIVITNLSGSANLSTKEFTFNGSATIAWDFLQNGSTLKTTVTFALNRTLKNEVYTTQCTFNLSTEGQLDITSDVYFSDFKLDFILDGNKWKLEGNLSAALFNHIFTIGASYDGLGDAQIIKLKGNASTGKNLLQMGKLSLRNAYFDLSVSQPKGKKARQVTGQVGTAISLAGTDIDISAALKDNLTFSTKINELSLSVLSHELLGIERPEELPDIIFRNITADITPAKKEFSFYGEVSGNWKLEAGTANIAIHKAVFDFKYSADTTSCDIIVTGSGQVTDDIKFNEFSLVFGYNKTSGWKLQGDINSTVFEQNFKLGAAYISDTKSNKKTVNFSYNKVSGKPLISVPDGGSLDVRKVEFSLIKEKEKSSLVFSAESNLVVPNLFTLNGVLGFSHTETGDVLSFTPKDACVTVPLFPLPNGEKLNFIFEFGPIKITRENVNGKSEWGFSASTSFSCPAFNTILPPEIKSIFPDKITTTFTAKSSGVTIVTDKVLDVRVDIPPIKMDGGIEIPLGLTRFSLTNLAITIGKDLSLSLDFGLGLPANFNNNFGTKDGGPLVEIFNTFKAANPEPTTIRLKLAVSTKGVKVVLATSPFAFITFQEKDGKVWCYADFKECGAIRFQVPEFSLDLATRAFVFNGGFEVVRELAIPLHLLKILLKEIKADSVAKILPDKVPIQQISLLDKNDKLDTAVYVKLVKDLLGIDTPDELLAALKVLEEGVNRLPDSLRKYLKITLPKSFNIDIVITPENQGVSIKMGVKKGDPPIRILMPASGPVPGLMGIELYSFSLGEIFATNFLLLEADIRVDHFDLLSLAGALALGTDHNLPLPSSNEIHRRFIVEDFFVLIFTGIKVYGIPIPIPIPLFYRQLGVEYYGLEGLKAQAHIGFPKPELDVLGLVKTIKDLVMFVAKPETRLDPKSLGKMDLRLNTGPTYLQLPQYLGGKSIGIKENVELPGAYETMATLLNAIKFSSINELIKAIPYKYRAGRETIQFGPVSATATYLLTTADEFKQGAYEKLNIPQEKTAEYMKILPVLNANQTSLPQTTEEGLVLFLQGEFGIKKLISGEAVFGLAASGSMGFHTGFRVRGNVLDLLEMEMAGRISVNPGNAIVAQKGNSVQPPIRAVVFNGVDTFVTLPQADMDFSQGLTLELWLQTDEFLPNAPIIELGNADNADAFVLKTGERESELVLGIHQQQTPHTITITNIFKPGDWMHLAISINSQNGCYVYKDGVLLNAEAMQIQLPAAVKRNENFLGRNIAGTSFYKGKLTDVRLWDKPLAAETINGRKDRRLAGNEDGLLAYWPKGYGADGKSHEITWRNKTRVVGTSWPDAEEKNKRQVDFTGLLFDGTDNYVAVENPFAQGEDFTLSAWVKPANIAEGRKRGIMGAGALPALWMDEKGALGYELQDAEGRKYNGQLDSFFTKSNKWVHIAWVKEGEKLSFYRDGRPFAIAAGPVAYNKTGSNYTIGKTDTYWSGVIDEVQVWERALDRGEIKSGYTFAPTGFEPGLAAYWPFIEGLGSETLNIAKSDLSAIHGAQWMVEPVMQPAGVVFSGRQSFIEVGHTAVAPLALEEFTMEAWVFPDAFPEEESEKLNVNGWRKKSSDMGWQGGQDGSGWNSEGAGWAGQGAWSINPWKEIVPEHIKEQEKQPQKDGFVSFINAWEGSPSVTEERGQHDNFYWGLKGSRLYFACGIHNGNRLSFYSATSQKNIKAGQWSHIAVARAGNKITFYINGVAEEITAVFIPNGKINTAAIPARIGGQWRGKSQSGFAGGMDELRIWNKPRTAAEIKQTLQKRLLGNEAGLLTYWPFSENSLVKTLDFAAQYNGILNNVSWKNAVPFDFEGLKFNGKGDYVDLGTGIKAGSKFTFEAWVKGERGTLFERQGGKDNKGFISIRFNNSIEITTAKGELMSCPLKGLPVNQWFHLAVACDGKQVKTMVDGTETASYTLEGKPAISDGIAYLGKGTDENFAGFKGVLDDIRIWGFARNTYQVKSTMYERLSGQEAGLLNYWPMLNGEGLTIYDFAGRNNGKLHGASWKKQKHLELIGREFNGADDEIRLNNPFTTGKDFTISVWLNPTAINTGYFYGIMGNDAVGDDKRKPSLWQGPNSGTLHYDSYHSSPHSKTKYSGSVEGFFTSAGAWVHLAWVKAGTQYNFYRNGELFAQKDAPENIFTEASQYSVGKVDTGWRGLMDEVRIWDKALSQDEIKGDLYFRLTDEEEGLVAYLPLGEEQPEFGGRLAQMQKNQQQNAPPAQAVGFKLDGLIFNGEDDYIDLGENVPFGTSFTVEAWVKGTKGTIMQRNANPQQKGHIELTFNDVFRVVTSDGTIYELKYNHMPANEWTHVAATYNGIAMQLYINGQNVASLNAPGKLNAATAQMVIGKQVNGESNFAGAIDEIRLWSVARSAEEIQADMNRALAGTEEGMAGYWPLLEGAGFTTFDKAGRNNGKLRGAAWVQAPIITMEGLAFNGAGDYINGGAVFSTPQKEITVELWFKADNTKNTRVLISKENLLTLAITDGYLQYKWAGAETWQGGESFAVQGGVWHHVAFTYNGREIQLYKDGASIYSQREFTITLNNRSEVFIGALNGATGYFEGEIHSVRIWENARDNAEVVMNRYKHITGDEPGLAAAWILQKDSESPLENLAAKSIARWSGTEMQRSASQTDILIDKILSGENAIETASANAPFVIAGHAHLNLVGKNIFTGNVLLQDDVFAFNGKIDLFPQYSPLQVQGSVRGAIAKHRFVFAGDMQTKLFGFVVAGSKLLISEKGFVLTGTLLEQSVTLSLEKESENRMIFNGSLDTPIKLGEIFQLTAGESGALANTGPKLKIAGPDNPEFHFMGYLKVLGISQQTAISFKDNGFTAVIAGSLWGKFNSKLTLRGTDLKNLGAIDFTAEFENGLHELAVAVKEYLNAIFKQTEDIINGAQALIKSAKNELQNAYEEQKRYWQNEAERRRKEVENRINEIQDFINGLKSQGDEYMRQIWDFQRKIEQASAEFSNKIYHARRDVDNAQHRVNELLHEIRSTENWYNGLPNIDWPWNHSKARDWGWVGVKLGALWAAYGVATVVLRGVNDFLWLVDETQKKAVEGLHYSVQTIQNLKNAIDASINNSFDEIRRINASVPAWVYSPELVVIEVGHTIAQGTLDLAHGFTETAKDIVKGIQTIANACLDAVINFPIQITYAKFTGKLGTATSRKFSVYMEIKYLDAGSKQMIPSNVTLDVDFDDLPGTAVRMIAAVMPAITKSNAELMAEKQTLDANLKELK